MGKALNAEQIKTILNPVFRIYNVRKAVLFGSYAKNEANAKSDVDIFVDSGLKGMRFVGFVEKIRQALGDKEVDVLDSSYINSDSKILDEINQTGILVYER